MAEFTIAKFKDVSEGLQEGQFAVGERTKATFRSRVRFA